MKPKFKIILENAIEEGVKLGSHCAYEHNESPSEEHIFEIIETTIWGKFYEYFDFDD
jgi:hypothetical protein